MTRAVNVHEFRVRAHQTDLNASMRHGAYLDIFDDARIETFRKLGYDYAWMRDSGLAAVIRRIEAEFYAPSWMDDLLTVTVTTPRLTRATLEVHYEARRGEDLAAAATVIFAFLNASARPMRIPPDLRQTVVDNAEVLGFNRD